MNTVFLLMAEFETPTIPLESIRQRYFNINSKREADKQARNHTLPIHAFRLGGQRSDWYVHIEDLARHIDTKSMQQKEAWEKINSANRAA